MITMTGEVVAKQVRKNQKGEVNTLYSVLVRGSNRATIEYVTDYEGRGVDGNVVMEVQARPYAGKNGVGLAWTLVRIIGNGSPGAKPRV